MTDDEESKRIILLRRARFVAAALATATLGASTSCGLEESAPEPCLTFYGGGSSVDDAGPDGEGGSGGGGGRGGISLDASSERG